MTYILTEAKMIKKNNKIICIIIKLKKIKKTELKATDRRMKEDIRLVFKIGILDNT